MMGRGRGPARWMMPTILLAAVSGWTALSCSNGSKEDVRTEVHRGALEQGQAARVGGEVVTVEQVRALSEAQSITPQEARSRLVFDALMAAGARARGYDRHDDVVVRSRAALARSLLAGMKREAEGRPISDEEVRKFTQMHWLEMDRPVARRTTHAVVMPKEPKDEEQAEKADEIAKRIAQAVSSATDAKGFKEKAKSVDAEGMKVVIQDLPPVTQDGRVANLDAPAGSGPQTFDLAYVNAVFGLGEVGDKTQPFRSPFGTHVAMLVGIQPEKRIAFEKRRTMLTEEIRTARVRKAADALEASLRKKTPPSIERNANALMQLIVDKPAERGP